MDNDGDQDLAVTNADQQELAILLATGDGYRLSAHSHPAVGRTARGIVAADFDGDGFTDLAVASVGLRGVVVLLNRWGLEWTRSLIPTGLAPFEIDAGDVNGDGRPDLAVANESNIPALADKGTIAILIGDEQGHFHLDRTLLAGTNPADVRLADFNSDGNLDLASVSWGSREIRLFFGHGDGSFQPSATIPYGRAPAYALAAGDLDLDGYPDLALADVTGGALVYINNRQGGFLQPRRRRAGRGSRSVAVADLDGDGAPEIVTADTADDTITVLPPPGHPEDPRAVVRVGHAPRHVVPADLNADGCADLVVTNGGSGDLSLLLNGCRHRQ